MRESSWTEKQLRYLIKNWHKMSNTQIGNAIGKTESAVRNKADKIITFEMMRKRKWSQYEDELLIKLYGTMHIEELSERLKRTIRAIELRINLLEGSISPTVLQSVYNTSDIGGFLGISNATILRRIKRGEIPCYKVRSHHLINEDLFWEWLKDNLHQPNYKAIQEEYELISPEWYRKVIAEKKRELRDVKVHEKWTSRDEALLWSEMMKGTPYKVIAKMLGRGLDSITKKAIELRKKKMLRSA